LIEKQRHRGFAIRRLPDEKLRDAFGGFVLLMVGELAGVASDSKTTGMPAHDLLEALRNRLFRVGKLNEGSRGVKTFHSNGFLVRRELHILGVNSLSHAREACISLRC
jgi:hypothetical protein